MKNIDWGFYVEILMLGLVFTFYCLFLLIHDVNDGINAMFWAILLLWRE